jgi:hypothetical protein
VRVKQIGIPDLRAGSGNPAGTPAAASAACSRLNATIASFSGSLARAACISTTPSAITGSAVISDPLRLL